MALTAAFERLGLRVGSDEFLRLVDAAVEDFLPTRATSDPRHELTPDEVRLLEASGVPFQPRATGPDAPLVRTAAEYAALLAGALSVPRAAAHLRVDTSRVRQRLATHTLYGIRQPSGWRLPRLQFTEDGLVPAFERLAPRLVGVDPVSVARWLSGPHPDLVIGSDETPVSPLDWLRMGRDPEPVLALATELHGVA